MTNPLDTAAVSEAERLHPRVDLGIAAVIFLFGAAIAWHAYTMPTFREQKGDIFTAPGIVPGFYGIMIVLLSLTLAGRAILRSRRGLGPTEAGNPAAGLAGLALVALLCLVFAVGLVTRLPFWLASAIFVSVFIVVFEWRAGATAAARRRLLAIAAAIGLATGIAVTLVFERAFLVRLP
ncbi:MAG: tripartite tricarboxylate transporter TctB family protein [Alphaproteobacteria bacterium]|nr:tripartite tricarboxylate transporter TctB family protein [Alphaproteobacteria bacterium]